MSEQGKKPFCVLGGECIGNVPTIEDLAYYIGQYIAVDPKLNLADLFEKNHISLENVLPSQHHVKTASGEISLVDLLEKSHESLSDLYTNNHHEKTESNEISLASLLEKAHASLSGVSTSQHHVKTVSNEISLASLLEKSYASLTSVPVSSAGGLNTNLDGGSSKKLVNMVDSVDDQDYTTQ